MVSKCPEKHRVLAEGRLVFLIQADVIFEVVQLGQHAEGSHTLFTIVNSNKSKNPPDSCGSTKSEALSRQKTQQLTI